jgi:hypothetical protein
MVEYLTTEQAAGEYQVPTATLIDWRYKGVGPAYVKLGRHVRYLRDDLDHWAAERRSPGSAA